MITRLLEVGGRTAEGGRICAENSAVSDAPNLVDTDVDKHILEQDNRKESGAAGQRKGYPELLL